MLATVTFPATVSLAPVVVNAPSLALTLLVIEMLLAVMAAEAVVSCLLTLPALAIETAPS